MVLINGLGQALAFLQTKSSIKSPQYQYLYNQMSSWLQAPLNKNPNAPFPTIDQQSQTDLLKLLVESDQNTYRLAQIETMAYLEWAKKIAVANKPEEDSGVDNTSEANEVGGDTANVQ